MFELVLIMTLATAAPTPAWTPPPPHIALDYAKPGQPHLTARQVARIRQVLAQVKPCQRPLVYYVIEPGENKDGVAFFFYNAKNPDEFNHVFGESNGYYFPGSGLIAGPNDMVSDSQHEAQAHIQWDIAHQPCPPNSR